MKIYFPAITFQGSPIVWELDQQTHEATCLLSCIKRNHAEVPISIDVFKEFPGITIENGAVSIKDIRTFNTTYQSLDVINEFKSQITPVKLKDKVLRKDGSFFKFNKINLDELSPIKKSVTSEAISLHNSIVLDEVIKKTESDATLWGDTIAYENYFEQKTSNDAKSRKAIYLKSEMSFHIMVQYEKNNRLYPLKSALIKEIRTLLEMLDPTYREWCNQSSSELFSKKPIIRYLQDAILEAMLNSRLNNKATEFETSEALSLSPALQKYAIARARTLRAELMLMKFNVLTNPELPIELALEEKTMHLIAPLTSLREFILQQPLSTLDDIQQQLKQISNLIIQAGIIEVSNSQLSPRLNDELNMNAPVVMNFYSFKALLHTHLEKQIPSHKKALIPDIVSQVMKETIKQLDNNFDSTYSQFIAHLSTLLDKNFYLCHEWADKLNLELGDIKLKNPKEEKKINAYAQAIASKTVDFVQHQLQEHISTLKDEATLGKTFSC